jgi:hypothetical protein
MILQAGTFQDIDREVLHRIICNQVSDCEEAERVVEDLITFKHEWLNKYKKDRELAEMKQDNDRYSKA